ncbi:MAG: type II toxin-antitoxin system HicA family toxin [Deltaproteobacteria bacterium]|nr:type II toxin-antitoxin system HicA family toxin [Deltaproteobacteria bacterium]
MVELKRVSGKTVIRPLERLGFVQTRQQGSHVVLKKMPEAVVGCVVPLHRELAVGTLRAIQKQGGVSLQDFLDNL